MKSRFRVVVFFGSATLVVGVLPCRADELTDKRDAGPTGVEIRSDSSPIVPPVRRVAPRLPEDSAKRRADSQAVKKAPAGKPKKQERD